MIYLLCVILCCDVASYQKALEVCAEGPLLLAYSAHKTKLCRPERSSESCIFIQVLRPLILYHIHCINPTTFVLPIPKQ